MRADSGMVSRSQSFARRGDTRCPRRGHHHRGALAGRAGASRSAPSASPARRGLHLLLQPRQPGSPARPWARARPAPPAPTPRRHAGLAGVERSGRDSATLRRRARSVAATQRRGQRRRGCRYAGTRRLRAAAGVSRTRAFRRCGLGRSDWLHALATPTRRHATQCTPWVRSTGPSTEIRRLSLWRPTGRWCHTGDRGVTTASWFTRRTTKARLQTNVPRRLP